MTTFNRAAYILESVKSVQEQSYTNWELIIVDDGSQDNTKELIDALNDKRILFHEAGKTGLGVRLKSIGIRRSDGELIAFIDSDDLWEPVKLAKQVAAMQAYPGAGFCITGGYNFYEKDEPVEYFYPERQGIYYGNIFLFFFRSKASVFPQTLMMRRDCLPVIEQCVQTSPGSDVDFLLELALQYQALIVYESLLRRRLHPASFSHSNWITGYEEGIEVIRRYQKRKQLSAGMAKDSLFRLYINFGESYYSRNCLGKALIKLWHAWIFKPYSIVPLKKSAKFMLGM